MDFNSNTPIYQQIVDCFKSKIVAGTLEQHEKIQSVRELAVEYGVNPNTMQKAMAELEREGLVYTERTSGRFVTSDRSVIDNLKKEALSTEIKRFLAAMSAMGCNKSDTIKMLGGMIE